MWRTTTSCIDEPDYFPEDVNNNQLEPTELEDILEFMEDGERLHTVGEQP